MQNILERTEVCENSFNLYISQLANIILSRKKNMTSMLYEKVSMTLRQFRVEQIKELKDYSISVTVDGNKNLDFYSSDKKNSIYNGKKCRISLDLTELAEILQNSSVSLVSDFIKVRVSFADSTELIFDFGQVFYDILENQKGIDLGIKNSQKGCACCVYDDILQCFCFLSRSYFYCICKYNDFSKDKNASTLIFPLLVKNFQNWIKEKRKSGQSRASKSKESYSITEKRLFRDAKIPLIIIPNYFKEIGNLFNCYKLLVFKKINMPEEFFLTGFSKSINCDTIQNEKPFLSEKNNERDNFYIKEEVSSSFVLSSDYESVWISFSSVLKILGNDLTKINSVQVLLNLLNLAGKYDKTLYSLFDLELVESAGQDVSLFLKSNINENNENILDEISKINERFYTIKNDNKENFENKTYKEYSSQINSIKKNDDNMVYVQHLL